MELIYNKGKYWEVDEYNRRLSEENKVNEIADKEIDNIWR